MNIAMIPLTQQIAKVESLISGFIRYLKRTRNGHYTHIV